jgi:hypothetical protein
LKKEKEEEECHVSVRVGIGGNVIIMSLSVNAEFLRQINHKYVCQCRSSLPIVGSMDCSKCDKLIMAPWLVCICRDYYTSVYEEPCIECEGVQFAMEMRDIVLQQLDSYHSCCEEVKAEEAAAAEELVMKVFVTHKKKTWKND